MKSPKLSKLHDRNKTLKQASWKNYRRLLINLVSVHSSYPEVKRLGELIRSNEWLQVYKLADSFASQQYGDARQHFVLNQFAALIRKYPFPSKILNLDPKGKAISTFFHDEHRMARVNRKFGLLDSLRSPRESELKIARDWIAYVLGDEPNMSAIINACEFGPGASMGVHGNATNLGRKLLSDRWSVTPSTLIYATWALRSQSVIWQLLQPERGQIVSIDPDLFDHKIRSKSLIVNNNKVSFVPKTAKTHRGIAIEPLLNGLVQKGIDTYMRKLLARVGIDLSDQTINQEYAKSGSLGFMGEDDFVTIDLSSASDSVSIGLVKNLLPPAWYELLNATRSHAYEIDGTFGRYHKFCSMGNGFCFPLETLIFSAICHACNAGHPGHDFLVYGDDIIVRQKHGPTVLNLLKYCGFRPNANKTFLEGPFRESCGADWYHGQDVRPYTLDHSLRTVVDIYKVLNLSQRNSLTKEFFQPVRKFLYKLIPGFLFTRPFKGDPDTGIDVELDEFMSNPKGRWNSDLQTWMWLELKSRSVSDKLIQTHSQYHLALMYGALAGVDSGKPFTVRRLTRQTIARVSYAGSQSTWEPGTRPKVSRVYRSNARF